MLSIKKGISMFYPKNIPQIERVLRIALGVILVGIVLIGPSIGGNFSPLIIGLLLFSAVFVIVTGFVGWCPACAMIGRKISSKKS
jgi:hypothetical protein